MRDRQSRHVERSRQVHAYDVLPIVGRHFVRGCCWARDSRVVDENVEPAQRLQRSGNETLDVRALRDIADDRECSRDLGGEAIKRRRVDIANADIGALCGKRTNDLAPDAARAGRHEDFLMRHLTFRRE